MYLYINNFIKHYTNIFRGSLIKFKQFHKAFRASRLGSFYTSHTSLKIIVSPFSNSQKTQLFTN